MRSWQVHDTDDDSGLRMVDIPQPTVGLVVEVRAGGVGFPDLLMRQGQFQIRQPTPFTLGWEASGVVIGAPPESRFGVGDEVMTLSFGAFADRVVADESTTMPKPPSLSFVEAAAVPLNYLTAMAGLRHRGRLAAGETVLVHGAGGGAGSAAVHVARALGAGRVIGLASSDSKARAARAAGADQVVGPGPGWRGAVEELCPGGVDLVYDTVGGDRFADSLRSLGTGGRLVVVGFAGGAIPTLAVNRLLYRNVDVCGATWSVLAEIPGALERACADVSGLFASDGGRPQVGEVFAFEQLPEALGLLAARRAHGKVVITT